MLNKLCADAVDEIMDELYSIRGQLLTNTSFHVDEEKQKEIAKELRIVADLIYPDELNSKGEKHV